MTRRRHVLTGGPAVTDPAMFDMPGGGQGSAPPAIRREPEDAAWVVALASLPGIGPAMLRRLLAFEGARVRWHAVRVGRLEASALAGPGAPPPERRRDLLERWQAAAQAQDPERDLAEICRHRIAVLVLGDDAYPAALAAEPTAPAVCFGIGRLLGEGALQAAGRVAVVGTRSSTHYGEEVAAGLGAELSAAGVSVVSGLAAGIDAAAHTGALAGTPGGGAPPLAIVGGGVDVVYPASQWRLWSRVAGAGTILSEAPPAARPERWRFPLRNRLIAAASDVVVVVEAHRTGGAMHTVEAALARGIPVAAVPGSVRSAASEGTNALIADGAHLVRDADDVLALLALRMAARGISSLPRLSPPVHGDRQAARRSAAAGDDPATGDDAGAFDPAGGAAGASGGSHRSSRRRGPIERAVLSALGTETTSLEALLGRCRLPIGVACVALEALVSDGAVRREAGGFRLAR